MDTGFITRRLLLVSSGSALLQLVQGCASASPARGVNTAFTRQSVIERLDRITWGVNPSTADLALHEGFDRYLHSQLHPAGNELPTQVRLQIASMTISQQTLEVLVRSMEERRKAADSLADDAEKKLAQQSYQQEMNRLARESASRQILRALYSPNQVLEQMTWFWLNHFSVHQYKSNLRAMVADYEERAIRPHALGRFRELLGSVVHHPAMLRYLDNDQNASGHINENYARELMELHTLGVDGGYTQADVQQLARVLTGLGVSLAPTARNLRPDLQPYYVRVGLVEFNPARHDFGPKQIFGRPLTARGLGELEEALDRLARHPATAKFVCRKLAVFWMSDEPQEGLLNAMEIAFSRTDGDISQTLQAMFARQEFWDARKFKDPMRYVISAVRLAYDDRPILNTAPVLNWLNRMAEPPYGRQTPDGYPLDARAWDSAGQMATRFDISKAIGTGNAGLFRTEEPSPREQPAFPQLSNSIHFEWRASTLSVATRNALSQASSPQEWNTFLLASPEFMKR